MTGSSSERRWNDSLPLGATYQRDGACLFQVWAPKARKVEVILESPEERVSPLEPAEKGYHQGLLNDVKPGSRYIYRLDGKVVRPDPASHFQPQGVHGPSAVTDSHFAWQDQNWFGLPLRDYIFYELHIGTFTPEGTLDAIIPRLHDLRDLGITALELMPVAQFSGNRNWGYDGVCPFAVQNSYGGPQALKHLVNACHQAGLAVVLDVVYNHLGPEGNYLHDFGPYFTDVYHTFWGPMLNFDGPDSDEVRRFFLENALYWQTEFHIDALRLDAVHAIRDFSAVPFLQELAKMVQQQSEALNRRFYLIAESDLNDPRLILPELLGGYGLDAQWSDDFHHCLHVLLTGERNGYYSDFGGIKQFAKAFREGYAYTGEYSRHRRRRHGAPPRLNSTRQFAVCIQNHDQIGNRMLGDRLSQLASFEDLKLAASAVLLSPFLPLLFMGEEYGERAPFRYFISHTDPNLVEAVRQGRREEFASFGWIGEVPDPQAEATFLACKLNWQFRLHGEHKVLYQFYRELIRLRKQLPAIASSDKPTLEVRALEAREVLILYYKAAADEVCLILCFANQPVCTVLELPSGQWCKLLDSAEDQWRGAGSSLPSTLCAGGQTKVKLPARSVALFQNVQHRQ